MEYGQNDISEEMNLLKYLESNIKKMFPQILQGGSSKVLYEMEYGVTN